MSYRNIRKNTGQMQRNRIYYKGNGEITMSYIKGTYLEKLIDRTVDNWAKILGFVDEEGRARLSDGTFKADDKSTPEVNEAWESGKSPKKKVRRKTTKKRVKKSD